MQTKRWKVAKKLAENLKKVLTKYISCDIIIVSRGGAKKIKPPTERGNVWKRRF
jgi:hypothetical protein|nr:MAG TPA: Exonuclease VII, large subunit [Caudoviricetes sp.]DAV78423.1 MAG TPA: Exonuclease VII, large subunit [Caudoviricetes sp.]